MKKRTITSLKENEVIKIENRKQAKVIKKLSGTNFVIPPNGYFGKSKESGFYWCHEIYTSENKTIVPASDFITKKPKPATKKWVKEYAAQQLAKPKEVVEPEVVSANNESDSLIIDIRLAAGVEAGKWYNAYFSKTNGGENWGLIYIYNISTPKIHANSLSTIKTHADYYGKIIFGENKGWVEKDSLSLISNILSPATEQEVKDMLIEEAKKRGFKDGVKVKSLIYKNCEVSLSTSKEGLYDDGYWMYGCLIMQNGKWAEIIEQPKEEIDWSKAGTKVILKEDLSRTVMLSGEHNSELFSGMVIEDKLEDTVGRYSTSWIKYCFKLATNENKD